ncbi:hypothetical protein PPSIR1_08661 [Plesiocystis pacifica SIR-1]|uniref:Lipoprotein n=1 Tax=Plesiocystis pacifica SIR-1 TaxID=391625 RepID=A6G7A9_9BACT|nr:hypothetical protein [Plesiocystis pacifica]EDM78243.1 hypothetical protein PPSIR1_08661 [Plesiocystis pacifica SIR-1]
MPLRSASKRVLVLPLIAFGLCACEPPSGPGLDGDEAAEDTEDTDADSDTETTGTDTDTESTESTESTGTETTDSESSESESESESESSESESTTGEPIVPELVTQDGFDPLRDRWVRSFELDDDTDGLLTVNPVTGVESVLVDTWPWPADHRTTVRQFALDRPLDWAYVFVRHSYFSEEEGLYCALEEYVRADLETGEVEHLEEIEVICCDDCGDGREFDSPIIDPHTDTLRYIYADCDPNACSFYVREADPLTLEILDSEFVYDGYCEWGDEFECTEGLFESAPRGLTTSPVHDANTVVFTEPANWEHFSPYSEPAATQLLAELAPSLGGVELGLNQYRKYTTLDYANARAYVVLPVTGGYATVLQPIDGSPSSPATLVHAGSPDDEPPMSTRCITDVAFDSVRDRLLYYRHKWSVSCPDDDAYFAVDVDSGTIELLAP